MANTSEYTVVKNGVTFTLNLTDKTAKKMGGKKVTGRGRSDNSKSDSKSGSGGGSQ